MTPSWGDAGFSKPGSSTRADRWPTWPRVAVLVGALVLAFVVAKGCQDAQIRITQDRAVATAEEEVDFKPTFTQIRLLRQGLNRKPYWFVSLSIPLVEGDTPDLFAKLSVVKIDANTGTVAEIAEQSEKESARAKQEAARREALAESAEQQEQ